MSIIDNIKEQRKRDKEKVIMAVQEAKEYTKESFSKERRKKVLEDNIARMTSREMNEISTTQYTTHIKLLLTGMVMFAVGMIIAPVFLIALGLMVASLICTIKNWKRINDEYKQRKNIK